MRRKIDPAEKKSAMNIILSPKAKALAVKGADIFGGSISAYIAHLIIMDARERGLSVDGLTASNISVISNAKKHLKS